MLNSRNFEENCHLFIGLITALLFYTFSGCVAYENVKSLLDKIIDVSAIAIGFATTVQTILLAIQDKQIIIQLKDDKRYELVINYTSYAIKWCFASAVVSLYCIYKINPMPNSGLQDIINSIARNDQVNQYWCLSPFFMAFVIGVSTTGLIACIRVLWFITRILKLAK